MTYRIGADEPVRAAITRCAREQLDQAIRELSEGIGEDPVRAVHDARKAIKKERSLLRLARGAMPSAQRRRENATLRDAARALSGVRDADVQATCLSGPVRAAHRLRRGHGVHLDVGHVDARHAGPVGHRQRRNRRLASGRVSIPHARRMAAAGTHACVDVSKGSRRHVTARDRR